MRSNFEFYANPELKINFIKIVGEVSVLEAIERKREIINSGDYQENFNIVVDIREAIFTDFIQNFSKFTEFVTELSKVLKIQCKCAFLTSKPKDVVYSELLKLNFNKQNLGIKMEIFSTESRALDWLSKN